MRESAARLFRRRECSGFDALVLECLAAVDDDGFDFSFAEIDLELKCAKENGVLLFDLFDVCL